MGKTKKSKVDNKKSKVANAITKMTKNGPEELGKGVSKIVEGTADSLFNIMAVLYELLMAGALKISEKYGNKGEEIGKHKSEMVKYRVEQSKKALKGMGNGAKKVGKGAVNTVTGTAKTIALSLQDTVGGLRDEDKNEENKKAA